MKSVFDWWFNALILAVLVGNVGYVLAAVFGLTLWGRCLAGFGAVLLFVASLFLGSAAGIQGLESSTITRCEDGKPGEVRITLHLGPFEYTRVVPQKKMTKLGEE